MHTFNHFELLQRSLNDHVALITDNAVNEEWLFFYLKGVTKPQVKALVAIMSVSSDFDVSMDTHRGKKLITSRNCAHS